jgi:hypothetical protein
VVIVFFRLKKLKKMASIQYRKVELKDLLALPKTYLKEERLFLNLAPKPNNHFYLLSEECSVRHGEREFVLRAQMSINGKNFSISFAEKIGNSKYSIARLDYHTEHDREQCGFILKGKKAHIHLPHVSCSEPEYVFELIDEYDDFARNRKLKTVINLNSLRYSSYIECFNFALKLFAVNNIRPRLLP